jgi:hypothetical protein
MVDIQEFLVSSSGQLSLPAAARQHAEFVASLSEDPDLATT